MMSFFSTFIAALMSSRCVRKLAYNAQQIIAELLEVFQFNHRQGTVFDDVMTTADSLYPMPN